MISGYSVTARLVVDRIAEAQQYFNGRTIVWYREDRCFVGIRFLKSLQPV